MDAFIVDARSIRDISSLVLDSKGRLKVVPAEVYRSTTLHDRAVFSMRAGLYGLPTVELVAHLKALIAGRRAIEIGAGHGVLALALGIPATDNRQQEDPVIKAHYAALQQTTVPYGDNVEKLDALSAVEKYEPEVVIACWVTHLYDPARHEAGGNAWGVDESALLDRVATYVHIGNEQVHRNKAIWARPHTLSHPDWLYSRAVNGSRDFIAVWEQGVSRDA